MIIKSVEDLKKYKDSGGNIFSLDKNYKNLFFTDCERTDVYIFLTKDIIKSLKDYGLNINHKDKEGNTALFEVNLLEVAESLVECGIDKFARNNKGRNALDLNISYEPEIGDFFYGQNMYVYNKEAEWHLYVNTLNIDLIKEMIINGLNINAIDDRKRNVLFYNTDPICKEKILFLIESGIDLNVSDGIYENMFINYDASLIEIIFKAGYPSNYKNSKGENYIEKVNKDFRTSSEDEENLYLIEKIKMYIRYGCDYSKIEEKSLLVAKAISEVEKEVLFKSLDEKEGTMEIKKRI